MSGLVPLGCLAACGPRCPCRAVRGSVRRFPCRWFLPCRPPPGRPRWGLPGARGSPWRGACGPPPGVCFSQPSPGGPPGDRRYPRGFFPRLTMRKLSNGGFPKIRGRGFARRRASHFTARVKAKPPARCLGLIAQARGLDPAAAGFSAAGGLTFSARCAILFVRGSLAAPPGAALLGVQGARESRSAEKLGGFFSAPGIPPALLEVCPSVCAPALLLLNNRSVKARLTQQNLCHFVAFAASQKDAVAFKPSANASGPFILRAHKIMALFRLARCFHLPRHNPTPAGRTCQAFFLPGLLRRLLPAALSCLSAMA